jgi:putative FmdB family regulatory protein
MFDFECKNCGHQFEELVQPQYKKCKCPDCSSVAYRLIATPMINYRRMGVDPDFPTAGEKWAKMQEQRKRVEKEREL